MRQTESTLYYKYADPMASRRKSKLSTINKDSGTIKTHLLKLIRNLSKRAADGLRAVCGAAGQAVRGLQAERRRDAEAVFGKMVKSLRRTIDKGPSPHSISGNLLCLSSLVLLAARHADRGLRVHQNKAFILHDIKPCKRRAWQRLDFMSYPTDEEVD